MTFWRRQNHEDNGRIVVARGREGRGSNRWSSEDFLRSETILCDTVVMHTRHRAFVQTHRMYNALSESLCKLWTLDGNDVLT